MSVSVNISGVRTVLFGVVGADTDAVVAAAAGATIAMLFE